MRLLENRTTNHLASPLRILSILRAQWDEQRFPALQALADLGHEVVYVDRIISEDDYIKLVKQISFDVAVLWGNSFQNFLMTSAKPFFLDELNLPYVSLWTDNPIKHLHYLNETKTQNHLGLFVPDKTVLLQLRSLGFKQVFYLPPWHIDKQVFRPVDPVKNLQCDLSFAATVNSYQYERKRWRENWNKELNSFGDLVIDKLREDKQYVDVFDMLPKNIDPFSHDFNLISQAMYFEQKSIVREQIIEAIGEREIHITGIGLADSPKKNVVMHSGKRWNELSRVFCSATMNLNATPWPSSCHHRVFQITACRALAVTDWKDDATDLYEPDSEVIYFKSIEELPEIIDHYKRYPSEAIPISEAGFRRFISNHTAFHRMEELSNRLYELL